MTSARAIDSETLKKLYYYNMEFPTESLAPADRASDRTNWGGQRVRLMLQTVYIVSFLCLLRFDEALSMTWDNVHFEEWEGTYRIRLDLPVRKTHQCGGMVFCLQVDHIVSYVWHC